jgi:penicillin-binding protein 1C
LGASIAGDEQWRFPPIEDLPGKFVSAIICFEDRRFLTHHGVDILSIFRAVRDNFRSGNIVSGASTLTMQVIRLSHSGRKRTIWEKLIEIILALRLELSKSKEDILKLYASHAPFGGNVVGLEAAAWRYFGRDPSQLSWAETTMLAVLPNSPSLIHPGRNRELLMKKRNHLLNRLMKFNIIDSLTCKLAVSESLPGKPLPLPMSAPHLMQRIQNASKKNTPNVRWKTTIKKTTQIRAHNIIQRHNHILSQNDIHNAAALILEVNTGDVLAYIGNVAGNDNNIHGHFVDVITSPRSTGSLLKPYLYAGMLQSGDILPCTLIPDIPTRMGGFSPNNYTRTFNGAVPAFMALARSLNVPAVRMLYKYGVDRFYSLLKSLGMKTLFRSASGYGLSLILGGAEGTLWEMTGIYASMARSVNYFSSDNRKNPFFPPKLLMSITESQKNYTRPDMTYPSTNTPLSTASCWLTLQAMLEISRPLEEKGWRNFTSSQKIAWKTGTSYGYRDGWSIGVTPKYAVGVWIGNADGEGRPGLTGLGTAAPVLFDLFDLLESSSWFERPELELYPIDVCAKSGYLPGPNCMEKNQILVPKAGLEIMQCPYCRLIHCDASLQWRVHSECEPVTFMKKISWFVLPPAMEWFYKQKHSDYQLLPPYRPDCLQNMDFSQSSAMTLLRHDAPGSIYIPLELDGQRGKIIFEATHRHPDNTIFWHLDNEFITHTQSIHQIAISPEPGEHAITIVDENGESVSQTFMVLGK